MNKDEIRSLYMGLSPSCVESLEKYLDICFGVHQLGEDNDKHHILTRSLFPKYKNFSAHPWNKVVLPYSQHVLAHGYLFKAFPDMKNACGRPFFLMVRHKLENMIGLDELMPELILARKAHAEIASKTMLRLHSDPVWQAKGVAASRAKNIGFKHTQATLDKKSASLTGRVQGQEEINNRVKALIGKKRTEEQRKRISEAHKGIKQSAESIKKGADARRGRKDSDEARLNKSLARKGVSPRKCSCIICKKEIGITTITNHFKKHE